MGLTADIIDDTELLQFSGRLPVAAFFAHAFWRVVACLILYLLLTLFFFVMGQSTATALTWALTALFALMIPLIMRRFHDFGAPGWLAVLMLCSPIIMQLCAALFVDEGNAAGALIVFGSYVVTPAALVLLCLMTLWPSKRGSNKYGPNPNEVSQ